MERPASGNGPLPPGNQGAPGSGGSPPAGTSRPTGQRRVNSSLFWIAMLIAAILALMYWNNLASSRVEVTYDFFQNQVDANNVADVDLNQQQVTGRFRKPV